MKLAAIASALLGATVADAKTIHVNAALATGGDGTTWAQAFGYLQNALSVALPGDSIFLAKGTYFPDDGVPNGFGDRELSFSLNQVNLYGGFVGNETSFGQRDPEANPTILSGEIWEVTPQTPGYERYWSLHVVEIKGSCRIDGLTIQRGRANGEADPYNKGGGVLVTTGQTVTLDNCVLKENYAAQSGGAVSGKVIACHSTFSDNEVDNQYQKTSVTLFARWLFDPFCSGGAIDGETSATSCDFLRNVVNAHHLDVGSESSATGGAISGPNVWVTNCNFDANVAKSYSDPNSNSGGTSHAFSRGGAISGVTTATLTTFTNNIASSSSSSATSPNPLAIAHYKSYPESRGGAIAGESHLMNCVFDANSCLAEASFGDESDLYNAGSAVYLEGSSTVANCVFNQNVASSDNQSLQRGGFTYTRGAVLVAAGGELPLFNSTFHNNHCSGLGAAVSSEGSLDIISNIFWFEDPVTPGPDDIPQDQMIHVGKSPNAPVGEPLARISNRLYPTPSATSINLVKGGVSAITSGANAEIDFGAEPEQTLIGTDPGFFDSANPAGQDGIWRTADDGFRLQPTSPAKDLGLSTLLPADTCDLDHDDNLTEPLPVDLAGYDRLQGAEIDLGAYETGDSFQPVTILTHPEKVAQLWEMPATFTVAATGYDLRYQWFLGSSGDTANPVSGATGNSYTIPELITSFSYWVRVNNGLGAVDSSSTTVTVYPPDAALANALNSGPELTYFTWGDQPWTVQSTITHDGDTALQSGAITHSQVSQLDGFVSGVGVLRFWWKVSSEPGGDFVKFRVEGDEQASLSGESGWHEVSVSFPNPGIHRLSWCYEKDASTVGGSDQAWLDQVSWQSIPSGTSYANWASIHELTGDDALSTANPSGDGVNNLIKYALGLDPMVTTLSPTDGDNPGLPQIVMAAGSTNFIFIKDTANLDLTYIVETSTTLTDWSPVTAGIEETPLSGTLIRVVVTIPVSDQTFCRLKVAKQEGI